MVPTSKPSRGGVVSRSDPKLIANTGKDTNYNHHIERIYTTK